MLPETYMDPMPSPEWFLERDLKDVLNRTSGVWSTLAGMRLFITGGTGFIGRWLLETLRFADQQRGLGIHATILTRNPDAFARKAPHLAAYPGFAFISGDVTDFAFPAASFTHLVHAAAAADAELNENDPRCMFDTIVAGTRRVLDLAVARSIDRTLYLSSGAVYGRQPWELERVPESYIGAPDPTVPRNAYAEGKRAAEMLCAIYGKQFGLKISVARIFALLGPLLPLGIHFAAGNFIRDAMAGKTVTVRSNGKPVRSYLYAADLAVWLWHMLVSGEPGVAYNVGSDVSVSIAEIAERIANLIGGGRFEILNEPDSGWNPGRYVPDTSLASRNLSLYRAVTLDEAIIRTALWNGWGRR